MPSGSNRSVPHHGVEVVAGHRLDHLADPVDVDAVLPPVARIEQQRHPQTVVQRSRRSTACRCAPCRSRSRRSRSRRRSRPSGSGGCRSVTGRFGGRSIGSPSPVKPSSTWTSPRYGQTSPAGASRRQPALLDLLHGDRAGDRLRHRGDEHHGVHRHRHAVAQAALAEGSLVDHAVGSADGGDRRREPGRPRWRRLEAVVHHGHRHDALPRISAICPAGEIARHDGRRTGSTAHWPPSVRMRPAPGPPQCVPITSAPSA